MPRKEESCQVTPDCWPSPAKKKPAPPLQCLVGATLLTCVSSFPLLTVTAPSSPLSPPVSPAFLPPEPTGSKNGECTVCFDSEVDTVIYTCGHMCLCPSCGLRLKRQARACCPICRRPIKDVIKIYRP